MERIDRGYAIIYIDRTGESLRNDEYASNEMISDFWTQDGFLQWNFYLIIAKEFVPNQMLEDIENDDKYARKYAIKSDKIDGFIANHFPPLQPKMGKIKLVMADNFKKTQKLAFQTGAEMGDDSSVYYHASVLRDESLLYTLTYLDDLRQDLIIHPEMNAVYYTHIEHEYNLAKKKLHLLL